MATPLSCHFQIILEPSQVCIVIFNNRCCIQKVLDVIFSDHTYGPYLVCATLGVAQTLTINY